MRWMRAWAALLSVVIVSDYAAGQVVLYVSAAAVDCSGDGRSWATAFNDLQCALNVAAGIPEPRNVEIRMASGIYRPSRRTDPIDPSSATFRLLNGVTILGGYRGESGPERNPEVYVTELSGRFDDYLVYAIVTADGVDRTSVLDGVTVPGDRSTCIHFQAASMIVRASRFFGAISPSVSLIRIESGAPSFFDCTFGGNQTHYGAAIQGDNATFERCLFEENTAQFGGALYGSNFTCLDCVFRHNTAERGGVLYGEGASRFERCVFESRPPTGPGGVGGRAAFLNCTFLRNNGYVVAYGDFVSCLFVNNSAGYSVVRAERLENCLFAYNGLGSAGALEGLANVSQSAVNCTFIGNATCCDSAALVAPDTAYVSNCIFWQNRDSDGGSMDERKQILPGPMINHNFVQGWTGAIDPDGKGNIGGQGEDPMFVDPNGPDDVPGTLDDNLRLQQNSPCIDRGDSTLLPLDTFDLDDDGDAGEWLPLDLDLAARRVDDPLTPDTGIRHPVVDMGAYEFVPPPVCPCDFNNDGVLNSQDFFDFLGCFFSGCPQ